MDIQGLMVKKGNVDFVKAKLGIKKSEFIPWLNTQEGEWVNLDILVSKAGELYAKINDWKPVPKVPTGEVKSAAVPF